MNRRAIEQSGTAAAGIMSVKRTIDNFPFKDYFNASCYLTIQSNRSTDFLICDLRDLIGIENPNFIKGRLYATIYCAPLERRHQRYRHSIDISLLWSERLKPSILVTNQWSFNLPFQHPFAYSTGRQRIAWTRGMYLKPFGVAGPSLPQLLSDRSPTSDRIIPGLPSAR